MSWRGRGGGREGGSARRVERWMLAHPAPSRALAAPPPPPPPPTHTPSTLQGFVTRMRRLFDRCLTSLPVTQHDRIWPLYLKFIGQPGIPMETAVRVRRRVAWEVAVGGGGRGCVGVEGCGTLPRASVGSARDPPTRYLTSKPTPPPTRPPGVPPLPKAGAHAR